MLQSEIFEKLEGIQLQDLQIKKILPYFEQNKGVIKPADLSYFLDIKWVQPNVQSMILNENEIAFKYEQQTSLFIKIIECSDFIKNQKETRPQISKLLGPQGILINKCGINQDENGIQGNGSVKIGRNPGEFGIKLDIKDKSISKEQFKITHNPYTGFSIQCLQQYGRTYLNLQHKDEDGKTLIRTLYKNSMFYIDGDYILYVDSIQENFQDEIYQTFIKQEWTDLIPTNIQKNKIDFFKVQEKIYNEKGQKFMMRNNKDVKSEIYLTLKATEEDLENNIIQKQIIINSQQIYQESKQQGEFIFGLKQLNDSDCVDEKCLRIFYDNFSYEWKVECLQERRHIMLFLRNSNEIDKPEASKNYNIQVLDKITLLVEDEDDEDLRYQKLTFQLDINREGQDLDCEVCYTSFKLEDADYFNLFKCDHFICAPCQRDNIQVNMDQIRNYTIYKCGVPDCPETVKIEDLQNINQDLFQIYQIVKNQKQKIHSFNCSNKSCKKILINEYKIALREGSKPDKVYIECSQCKQKTCGNCLHTYQDKHVCKELIRSNLQNFKNLKEGKVRICPNCHFSFQKDDNCDHVVCFNCETHFCFECSCLREPTMVHDSMHHRPDCSKYCAYKQCERDKRPQPDKCSECKKMKNGERCPQPCSYVEFLQNIQDQYDMGEETIKRVRK